MSTIHDKSLQNCQVTEICHCDDVTSQVGVSRSDYSPTHWTVPTGLNGSGQHTSRWTLPLVMSQCRHNDNFSHIMTMLEELVMAHHAHTWWYKWYNRAPPLIVLFVFLTSVTLSCRRYVTGSTEAQRKRKDLQSSSVKKAWMAVQIQEAPKLSSTDRGRWKY